MWDIVWLVLAGHCRCHLFSTEIVGNYIHVVKNNNDGVGCQLLFEHNFPHGERHKFIIHHLYNLYGT